MKKFLLVLAALLVSTNLIAGELVVKIGVNDNENTKSTSKGKELEGKSSHSYNFQAEYYHKIDNTFFFGMGVGYNTPLKVDNIELVSLYPIYFTTKIKGSNKDFTPYAGLKLGWTVPRFLTPEEDDYTIDDKTGLFLGANTGLEFKNNLIVEIYYETLRYKSVTDYENNEPVTNFVYFPLLLS